MVNIKDIKNETGFALNPQSIRHSVQGMFFNTLFVVLTFQIIY